MNAETLEALKASIAKWERNTRVRKPENFKADSADCPLCKIFATSSAIDDGEECRDCPVMRKSGVSGCRQTPWVRAYWAKIDWADGVVSSSYVHDAARAEVEFLKSLLPEGEST